MTANRPSRLANGSAAGPARGAKASRGGLVRAIGGIGRGAWRVGWAHSEPHREMGPALRPTPLSPACGSRRGHLTPDAFDAASDWSRRTGATCGVSVVRRSRRRRFRRGPGLIARTCPCRPAVPRPVVSVRASSRSALSEDVASPQHELRQPAFRLCALAASTVWDWSAPGRTFERSVLIPPPRGISPSRRSGSKIPSPSPAFRPLPRKGQSPSRCLEDAPGDRFGQRRKRPFIHIRSECQWTRVDNSTVRRERRGIIPGRVAPAAAAAAH